MDLSSVHGQKLQMLFSHHYKSVDVRVQIKEMFLFFPILRRKLLFFSIFIPIFLLFASHLTLDTLLELSDILVVSISWQHETATLQMNLESYSVLTTLST